TEFAANKDHRRLASLLKLSYLIDVLIGIVSFAVVASLAQWLAGRILHKPEITSLVQLYSMTLLIATLKGTNNSVLLISGKFKWMSAYGASMPALELVLVAAAALVYNQLYAVVLALVLMEVIRLVVSSLLAVRALHPRYSPLDLFH